MSSDSADPVLPLPYPPGRRLYLRRSVTPPRSSDSATPRATPLRAVTLLEPLFIPRFRRSEAEEVNLSLLRRSFSLDRQSRRNFVGCGGCRPHSAGAPPAQRKVSKDRESRGFYDSVDREKEMEETCPPASLPLTLPRMLSCTLTALKKKRRR
ncbi:hypothetical protein KSP40_PGU015792 [Platanthera guangdongensis]|uniref:Uncharacterized protein n=1 Tax=Platanthera guangdongensis TaxID=2320717 RepID=A0ABR2LG47_9ASPA